MTQLKFTEFSDNSISNLCKIFRENFNKPSPFSSSYEKPSSFLLGTKGCASSSFLRTGRRTKGKGQQKKEVLLNLHICKVRTKRQRAKEKEEAESSQKKKTDNGKKRWKQALQRVEKPTFFGSFHSLPVPEGKGSTAQQGERTSFHSLCSHFSYMKSAKERTGRRRLNKAKKNTEIKTASQIIIKKSWSKPYLLIRIRIRRETLALHSFWGLKKQPESKEGTRTLFLSKIKSDPNQFFDNSKKFTFLDSFSLGSYAKQEVTSPLLSSLPFGGKEGRGGVPSIPFPFPIGKEGRGSEEEAEEQVTKEQELFDKQEPTLTYFVKLNIKSQFTHILPTILKRLFKTPYVAPASHFPSHFSYMKSEKNERCATQEKQILTQILTQIENFVLDSASKSGKIYVNQKKKKNNFFFNKVDKNTFDLNNSFKNNYFLPFEHFGFTCGTTKGRTSFNMPYRKPFFSYWLLPFLGLMTLIPDSKLQAFYAELKLNSLLVATSSSFADSSSLPQPFGSHFSYTKSEKNFLLNTKGCASSPKGKGQQKKEGKRERGLFLQKKGEDASEASPKRMGKKTEIFPFLPFEHQRLCEAKKGRTTVDNQIFPKKIAPLFNESSPFPPALASGGKRAEEFSPLPFPCPEGPKDLLPFLASSFPPFPSHFSYMKSEKGQEQFLNNTKKKAVFPTSSYSKSFFSLENLMKKTKSVSYLNKASAYNSNFAFLGIRNEAILSTNPYKRNETKMNKLQRLTLSVKSLSSFSVSFPFLSFATSPSPSSGPGKGSPSFAEQGVPAPSSIPFPPFPLPLVKVMEVPLGSPHFSYMKSEKGEEGKGGKPLVSTYIPPHFSYMKSEKGGDKGYLRDLLHQCRISRDLISLPYVVNGPSSPLLLPLSFPSHFSYMKSENKGCTSSPLGKGTGTFIPFGFFEGRDMTAEKGFFEENQNTFRFSLPSLKLYLDQIRVFSGLKDKKKGVSALLFSKKTPSPSFSPSFIPSSPFRPFPLAASLPSLPSLPCPPEGEGVELVFTPEGGTKTNSEEVEEGTGNGNFPSAATSIPFGSSHFSYMKSEKRSKGRKEEGKYAQEPLKLKKKIEKNFKGILKEKKKLTETSYASWLLNEFSFVYGTPLKVSATHNLNENSNIEAIEVMRYPLLVSGFQKSFIDNKVPFRPLPFESFLLNTLGCAQQKKEGKGLASSSCESTIGNGGNRGKETTNSLMSHLFAYPLLNLKNSLQPPSSLLSKNQNQASLNFPLPFIFNKSNLKNQLNKISLTSYLKGFDKRTLTFNQKKLNISSIKKVKGILFKHNEQILEANTTISSSIAKQEQVLAKGNSSDSVIPLTLPLLPQRLAFSSSLNPFPSLPFGLAKQEGVSSPFPSLSFTSSPIRMDKLFRGGMSFPSSMPPLGVSIPSGCYFGEPKGERERKSLLSTGQERGQQKETFFYRVKEKAGKNNLLFKNRFNFKKDLPKSTIKDSIKNFKKALPKPKNTIKDSIKGLKQTERVSKQHGHIFPPLGRARLQRRPDWSRATLAKKFLQYRHTNGISSHFSYMKSEKPAFLLSGIDLEEKTFSETKRDLHASYLQNKRNRREFILPSSFRQVEKEYYSISQEVFAQFEKDLWKSSWRRANLNSYLAKVKTCFLLIKETSTKRFLKDQTFLLQKPNFVTLISSIRCNNPCGLTKQEFCEGLLLPFPSFRRTKGTSSGGKGIGIGIGLDKPLSVGRGSSYFSYMKSKNGEVNLFTAEKWTRIAEYNQITYDRIQDIIKKSAHPSLINSSSPFNPFNNAREKLKQDINIKMDFLSFVNKIIQTTKTKLQKTLREHPFFTVRRFGNISEKKVYWALNKTHMGRFKKFNKKEYFWSNQKQRKLAIDNKTKKLIQKSETLINLPLQDQYNPFMAFPPSRPFGKGQEEGASSGGNGAGNGRDKKFNIEKFKKNLNTLLKKQKLKETKIGDMGFLESNSTYSNLNFVSQLNSLHPLIKLYKKNTVSNPWKEEPAITSQTDLKKTWNPVPLVPFGFSEGEGLENAYEQTLITPSNYVLKEHKLFLRNLKNSLRVVGRSSRGLSPFLSFPSHFSYMKSEKNPKGIKGTERTSSSSGRGTPLGLFLLPFEHPSVLQQKELKGVQKNNSSLFIYEKREGNERSRRFSALVKKSELEGSSFSKNQNYVRHNFSTVPFLKANNNHFFTSTQIKSKKKAQEINYLSPYSRGVRGVLRSVAKKPFFAIGNTYSSPKQKILTQKDVKKTHFFLSFGAFQQAFLLSTVVFHLSSLLSLINVSQIRGIIQIFILFSFKVSSFLQILVPLMPYFVSPSITSSFPVPSSYGPSFEEKGKGKKGEGKKQEQHAKGVHFLPITLLSKPELNDDLPRHAIQNDTSKNQLKEDLTSSCKPKVQVGQKTKKARQPFSENEEILLPFFVTNFPIFLKKTSFFVAKLRQVKGLPSYSPSFGIAKQEGTGTLFPSHFSYFPFTFVPFEHFGCSKGSKRKKSDKNKGKGVLLTFNKLKVRRGQPKRKEGKESILLPKLIFLINRLTRLKNSFFSHDKTTHPSSLRTSLPFSRNYERKGKRTEKKNNRTNLRRTKLKRFLLNTYFQYGFKPVGTVFYSGFAKLLEIKDTGIKAFRFYFERPSVENIARELLNKYLVIELASGLTTNLPEKLDKSIWKIFTKLAKVSSLRTMPILGTLLEKRIFSSFEILIERLGQPNTDLIVRQEKGQLFLATWGEALIKLAKQNKINMTSFSKKKEDQTLLLSKLIQSETKKGGFSLLLKKKQNSSPLSLRVRGQRDWSISPFGPLWVLRRREGKEEEVNSKKELRLGTKIAVDSLKNKNWRRWSASQFIIFKDRDTNLIIQAPPAPKSLHSLSLSPTGGRGHAEKGGYNAISNLNTFRLMNGMAPLGSIICQIYSGNFVKKTAKNLLVIGLNQGLENNSNLDQKSLLIQSLAGETEMTLITDNANRYNFSSGIKLLRTVFNAVALQAPCIFLIEDIHVIGLRRPLANSDDEKADDISVEGIQLPNEDSAEEKHLILARAHRYSLMQYGKSFRGEFSTFIQANNFASDLFLGVDSPPFARSKQSGFTPVSPFSLDSSPIPSLGQALPSPKGTGVATLPVPLGEEGRAGLIHSSNLNSQLTRRNFLKSKNTVAELPWMGLPASIGPEKQLSLKSFSSSPSFLSPTSNLKLGSRKSLQNPNNQSSIREKIALLASLAVSSLSTKLNMITDLLVILDSVRSNRGFVVFATTHTPSILDPGLRRPGRLDETIALPFIPKLESRWEIVKSNVASLNTIPAPSFFDTRSSVGAVGITLPLFSTYPKGKGKGKGLALQSSPSHFSYMKSENKGNGRTRAKGKKQDLKREAKGDLGFPSGLTIDLLDYGLFNVSLSTSNLQSLKIQEKLTSFKKEQKAFAYSPSFPFPPFPLPKVKGMEGRGKEASLWEKGMKTPFLKRLNRINETLIFDNILEPSSFDKKNHSPRFFHTVIPRKGQEDRDSSLAFPKGQQTYKNKINSPSNVALRAAYEKIGTFLVNNKFAQNRSGDVQTNLSLFYSLHTKSDNQTSFSELLLNKTAPYLHLYSKQNNIKQYLLGLFAPKVAETFAFSLRKAKKGYLLLPLSKGQGQEKNPILPLVLPVPRFEEPEGFFEGKEFLPFPLVEEPEGFSSLFIYEKREGDARKKKHTFGSSHFSYMKSEKGRTKGETLSNPQSSFQVAESVLSNKTGIPNFGLWSLKGIEKTWRAASSLIFKLIEKRLIYKKTIIIPKLLQFFNAATQTGSLQDVPSPLAASLLLPAKRYESYKRTFLAMQRSSNPNAASRYPSIPFPLPKVLLPSPSSCSLPLPIGKEGKGGQEKEGRGVPVPLGPFGFSSLFIYEKREGEEFFDKPTGFNGYYRNRILDRHRGYLNNQWWNGQLVEHNLEAISLSDIELRTSVVSLSGSGIQKIQPLRKNQKASLKIRKAVLTASLAVTDSERLIHEDDQTRNKNKIAKKLPRQSTNFLNLEGKAAFISNESFEQKQHSLSLQEKEKMEKTIEKKDYFFDYPDFDQHYNPGNRRWVLHFGYWSYWYNFKVTHNAEIYSYMVTESFLTTFNFLNSNREIMDYFVTKILKSGLIKEISLVEGLKRF